jgi:hypothetical protein
LSPRSNPVDIDAFFRGDRIWAKVVRLVPFITK